MKVWIKAVLAVGVLGASLLAYRNYSRAQGYAAATSEISNRRGYLQRLGAALGNYAGDHQGAYPARISELNPRYLAGPDEAWFGVAVLLRRNDAAVGAVPMIVGALDSEFSYVYVVFADGTSEGMAREAFERRYPEAVPGVAAELLRK